MNINLFAISITACMIFTYQAANAADSPIKSIDASGNITYADKPVTGATDVSKVKLQAGPSADEIKSAQQQAEKNISKADKIDLTPPVKHAKHKVSAPVPTTEPQVINAGRGLLKPGYGKPSRPIARPINRPSTGQPKGHIGGGRR